MCVCVFYLRVYIMVRGADTEEGDLAPADVGAPQLPLYLEDWLEQVGKVFMIHC